MHTFTVFPKEMNEADWFEDLHSVDHESAAIAYASRYRGIVTDWRSSNSIAPLLVSVRMKGQQDLKTFEVLPQYMIVYSAKEITS